MDQQQQLVYIKAENYDLRTALQSEIDGRNRLLTEIAKKVGCVDEEGNFTVEALIKQIDELTKEDTDD